MKENSDLCAATSAASVMVAPTFASCAEIGLAADGSAIAFDTGLVTATQEPIYCFCTQNRLPDARQPWHFHAWRRKGEWDMTRFAALPPMAHYFDDPSKLVLDPRRDLRVNVEHIVLENKERFPAPYNTMPDYQLQTFLNGAIANAAEIAQCAEAGVSVVHCAESNLKLASGFCPAEALRRAGVNLAIGTDGCASNNDLDMFGEMRTAALLAKGVCGDASALDATATLRAATLGGARALGWGERIGSIEPGKQADLVAVRLDALETQPVFHVVSQLVYACARHQVSDVWIAGVRKLRDGALVDVDVADLRGRARAWRERLAHFD